MSTTLVRSRSKHPVGPLAAAIYAALWVLTLAAGCGQRAETPKPAAAAHSYTIRGEVRLPGPASALGTAVFCAGTSYIAYTDGDGQYAISAVPPGVYTVVARRDGFKTLELGRVELPAEPSTGPSEVTLPAAVLQTEAAPDAAAVPSETPATSQPVGGLTGMVRLAGGASPQSVAMQLDQGQVAGSPDAAGRFALAGIAPGNHALRFEHDGYTPQVILVTVFAGRTMALPTVVELAQAESAAEEHTGILGTVLTVHVDGTARDTAPNASVLLIENQRAASVAADGTFAFEDLPPGHYTLAAQAPGFMARKRETVDLKNTSAAVVLILEEGKSSVTGTIVLKNPARQDRPAGSVAALTGTDHSGITDASGHFALTEVEPGGYTLLCSRIGYRTVEARDLHVPPGASLDVGTVTLERDVEAPRLVDTTPADGARDVLIEPVNTVTLTFSRRMDMATLRSGLRIDPPCDYAIVRGGGAAPDSASATDTVELRIRNIRTAAPLAFKTRYTVALDESVSDSDGTALEGTRAFSFQTGGLAILRTSPPANARNVATQSGPELTLYFNGIVDSGTLDARSIDISPTPSSLAVAAQTRLDPATGWTVYRLPMTWRYSTSYDVRLTGGIRSVDGAALAPSPYRFSFQTEAEPQLPGQ
jgi:hypothetical protein